MIRVIEQEPTKATGENVLKQVFMLADNTSDEGSGWPTEGTGIAGTQNNVTFDAGSVVYCIEDKKKYILGNDRETWSEL